MENKIKVDCWLDELSMSCLSSDLINFRQEAMQALRVANEDFVDVFNHLVKNRVIKVANLPQIGNLLSSTISEYKAQHPSADPILFTSSTQEKQEEFLLKIKEDDELNYKHKSFHTSFITFGLLDFINVEGLTRVAKSAPLLLLPITIHYNKNNSTFEIEALNSEVYLNKTLIETIASNFKIDISYPIDENFNLIEYLSFVAIKVRPLRWSVNNGCFIANYDITPIDNYLNSIRHANEIAEKGLVKNIAYYNSEFYRLNRPSDNKLDNKYLSLLDADYEEYKILRKVAAKDNLFVRATSYHNKNHLASNIITANLLNSQRVLVVYNQKEDANRLMRFLKEDWVTPFIADLDETAIDKHQFLEDLLNYDKYLVQPGTLDRESIQEALSSFYNLKNDFKRLINTLRKANEPLKISLNRILSNYYRFHAIDDIELNIKNIQMIDEKKLSEYIEAIASFKKSVENLKCDLQDHPFYGFTHHSMEQKNYLELKDAVISLSESVKKLDSANAVLKKYNFTELKTLKQAKAFLNIMTFAEEVNNCKEIYYKAHDIEKEGKKVLVYADLTEQVIAKRKEITDTYGEKVFTINFPIYNELLSQDLLRKKDIKKINKCFARKNRLKLDGIRALFLHLQGYYVILNKQSDCEKALLPELLEEYNEGAFDYHKIESFVSALEKYKTACLYLAKFDIDKKQYEIDNLKSIKTKEFMEAYRVSMQTIFNSILKKERVAQEYFDMNLGELEFAAFIKKVDAAAKNFISINDYIDYYLTRRQLNRLVPNLADILIDKETELYEKLFLKAFYKQLAESLFKGSKLFNNFTAEDLFARLENYKDFDKKRKQVVNSVIKNNYLSYFRMNLGDLKRKEALYLSEELLKLDSSLSPLSKITDNAVESIYNLKPCLLVPFNRVSAILANDHYQNYDTIIYLSDRATKVREAMPSLYKGKQVIVFDNVLISDAANQQVIDEKERNMLIPAAKASLVDVEFTSTSYDVKVLEGNKEDRGLKSYIVKILKEHEFEVVQDCSTDLGHIDILVRVPHSKSPTAIWIDRLSYQSPEGALDSFSQSEEAIRELGYMPYRIIPSTFFLHEKEEINSLVKYIVDNSHHNPERRVKKTVLLMDYLFKNYVNPIEAYYTLIQKDDKSNSDLILEVLQYSAPVKAKEITSLFVEDVQPVITQLVTEQKIAVNDDFIFLVDQPITFRTIDRNKNYIRKLDTIAPIEVKTALVKVINHQKEIAQDILIKMILLSLGYKKMNRNLYETLENYIQDIVTQNKVVYQKGVLKAKEN